MIIGGKHVSGPAGHYPARLAREIVLGIEEEVNKSLCSHEAFAVEDDADDEPDKSIASNRPRPRGSSRFWAMAAIPKIHQQSKSGPHQLTRKS